MRKKPQKPRDKPFFCHDENLEFYSLRKQCSREGRFKSIVKIVKRQGATDSEVIALCDKKDLHIITHNTKHFQRPKTGIKIGIICIGLKAEYYWIPKFIKLLKNFPKHKDYYHKIVLISDTITIKNRKTEDVRVF